MKSLCRDLLISKRDLFGVSHPAFLMLSRRIGFMLSRRIGTRGLLSVLMICAAHVCFSSAIATAQKKPKGIVSEKEARRVLASAPGFKLKTGAVKIIEISPAGASPSSVVAEVTTAFRLDSVADESAPQDTGIFMQKRWRAVEFRTGDREWEEFDLLAAPLGAERVEGARHALEELVTEFAARQREAGGKTVEPLERGPLRIKQLSLMGSSALAEVAVKATFRLSKDAAGKWRVSEILFGGESSGDLDALRQPVNAQKAVRARADLGNIRAALEDFRRERGFYVVGENSVVLLDHLNPRYLKRIIRLDPWHNPYRYNGTPERYTLASDGADGKSGTADDVALSSEP
jgi:hypothetical protein